MNGLPIEISVRLERDSAFLLDVDLSVPSRGITGIFGASGSGKTTLLRCIAGLEPGAQGVVKVGDEVWADSSEGSALPVQARKLGYVFQEPRLFAHHSVGGNLAYARSRRRSAGNPDEDEIIGLLGIAPLMDRPVGTLSGGEAQRVAIARVLVGGPRLVLMDEPLASLDRVRKEELLPFLDRLHAELSIPILYVSHSIDEVCRLCDHLVVLDAGRAVASGELRSVLTDVSSPLFDGEEAGSVVEAVVEGVDAADELARLSFSGGEFLVAGAGYRPGQRLRLRIRASDISLVRERPAASSILNILPAIIENIEEGDGGMATARLRVGNEVLLARLTRRSVRDLKLSPGLKVFAQVKSAAIRNVPAAGHLDPAKNL